LVNVHKAFGRLDLKRLVLILAFFGVLLTLGNALFAAYKVQKDLLVKDTLEANQVYASKLANVTDLFLESTLMQLEYSAGVVKDNYQDNEKLQAELDRLQQQTNSFNATIFVNTNGKVLAVSPTSLNLANTYIEDEQALEPLRRQQTYISEPFLSPADNLIVSITSPVFDSKKRFVGFVGGAIYLQENNILNQILEEHHQGDDSYTYVVDKSGKIIFHKDIKRIGETVSNNQIIDSVLAGISGSMIAENSQDNKMLAGFAPVELSK
jgi:cell division protein FtsB